MTNATLVHRLAGRDDLDALRSLMDAAISELQKPFLDERQISSSRTIMGLDTQLIDDEPAHREADGQLADAVDGAAGRLCMAATSRRGATRACSTRPAMQHAFARCTRIRTTLARASAG
jgi:hypothetical protein